MPQHKANRPLRMSLFAAPLVGALILAGCSGDPAPTSTNTVEPGETTPTATNFTMMIAVSNDDEDHWQQTAAAYAAHAGIDIEVIEYPGEAYNTQITTQLQAGNAADVMILSPGSGQAISVIPLAEAGFLEPLGEASSAIIPEGERALFEYDGQVYGQPAALTPVGLTWNAAAAAEVGIADYPTTYEDLLEACTAARDGGKVFSVIAGATVPNAGMYAMLISAARVYVDAPDWNQQRAAGAVTFADSDGWLETMEAIIEMNAQGCFQDGAAGGGFDNITAGVGGQTALSAATPGASAVSIGAATGLELTSNPFPPNAGNEGMLLASANYAWSLNAASSDAVKESVKDFFAWAAQPEQAIAFANTSGFVPITGATAADLPAHYQPIAELLESGSFTVLPNATWPNPAIYDALGSGVQGLLTGQKTPEQVLTDMDNAWG